MNSTPAKRRLPGNSAQPIPLLGGISADIFLRDYWQKKPLLIRNAVSDFKAPLTRQEVFTLARRDDAESRLIKRDANKWQLENGPFSASAFRLPQNILWTILVQDVQHFSYEAHELLERFNFIPRARIDDLMVSYAVPGAGVGPHFDSYDVFLLQGNGRRRWQISSQTDLRLKPDMPLKILSHFKPAEEFILDTGDMLYLPPSVAHNGIAETECLTWSIGFRAPSTQELSIAFLDYLRDSIQLSGQYADADIRSTRHPAQIDMAMQRRFANLLSEVQSTSRNQTAIRRFAGCYLTEPKSHVVLDTPESPLSAAAFGKQAMRYGLELELKTRILYDAKHIFISGEAYAEVCLARAELEELADRRCLSASRFAKIKSKPALAFFYQCYCEGAVAIGRH